MVTREEGRIGSRRLEVLKEPRDTEGAFLQTPITENGQSGFQEGNAVQYTWMVPQALGSLVAAMGGPQGTIARLDQFFSKLDAGQSEPFAWFGNEPSLASPWTYLYAGAPYKAQAVIRSAMHTCMRRIPTAFRVIYKRAGYARSFPSKRQLRFAAQPLFDAANVYGGPTSGEFRIASGDAVVNHVVFGDGTREGAFFRKAA